MDKVVINVAYTKLMIHSKDKAKVFEEYKPQVQPMIFEEVSILWDIKERPKARPV